MPQPNDLSRSLVTLDQNSTVIAPAEGNLRRTQHHPAGGWPSVAAGRTQRPHQGHRPLRHRLTGLGAVTERRRPRLGGRRAVTPQITGAIDKR